MKWELPRCISNVIRLNQFRQMGEDKPALQILFRKMEFYYFKAHMELNIRLTTCRLEEIPGGSTVGGLPFFWSSVFLRELTTSSVLSLHTQALG